MTDVSDPDFDGVCCPNCQSTPLDGQGSFRRSSHRRRSDKPNITVTQEWYQHHCPECDQTFATLEKKVGKARDDE